MGPSKYKDVVFPVSGSSCFYQLWNSKNHSQQVVCHQFQDLVTCDEHSYTIKQTLISVVTKLYTGEWFSIDPQSMHQAHLVWWNWARTSLTSRKRWQPQFWQIQTRSEDNWSYIMENAGDLNSGKCYKQMTLLGWDFAPVLSLPLCPSNSGYLGQPCPTTSVITIMRSTGDNEGHWYLTRGITCPTPH